MDDLIDTLLNEERCCDVILPRLTQRFVLEDNGELEVRESALQDELDITMQESGDLVASEETVPIEEEITLPVDPVAIVEKEKSMKKINKLFKKPLHAGELKSSVIERKEVKRTDGDMSIAETNKLRISLGMKPLA